MSRRNGKRPANEPERVVVTGGAGFVGTNVSHHFASLGAEVTVYDNLSRAGVERNARWLKDTWGDRVRVQVADVRDRTALGKAVRGADVVMHLAAQVAVTTSLEDPVHDFEVNAGGTLNVLEAVRAQRRPPALIFTSTNKVYGDLADVPLEEGEARYEPTEAAARAGVAEDRPLDFHSPYGCSKGAADQYVLDYARTWGIPAVVFRMSCIYGPHQHGTEDQGWVAHFLLRAQDRERITIFGDGKQVRDILYVDDLVRAFQRVLERMDDVRGEVFNVGGGRDSSTSLLELLEGVDRLDGCGVELNFADWRPGDQRWYVSDTRRLERLTGWERRVDVEEGVERLHAWLSAERRLRGGRKPARPAATVGGAPSAAAAV